MQKIIRLDKRHIKELAEIDWESEHQGDRERGFTKAVKFEWITERFGKGHEIWFGYKIGGELVAYITLKPFFPGYKHCEVYWLAVKKKCQNQGIGKKLMEFIEDHARKMGFRKIFVYTGKDMDRTREFYEKIGYKFMNEFPEYFGYTSGNTTAVLYCKKIV